MAPSLVSLGTAALALVGNAAATKWYIEDTYDSTNFFDKFNFFTDDSPNQGFVNFLSKQQAINAGIAKIDNGEVRLGVDSKNVVKAGARGRDSIRIESKAQLNKGLIIARFTHLPENKCGTWPAFWTVGNVWPTDGEVDMLEGWNTNSFNKPAFHMNKVSQFGSCTISSVGQSATVATSNCDNDFSNPPIQWNNQGCVANDVKGPWASADGGVYAMEWTSDFIKVYTWHWKDVPSNIGSDSPDSSTWGLPTIQVQKSLCNVDQVFKNQRIILNIDLCGNPVDREGTWDQCGIATGSTCKDYVTKNPSAFANVFFKVKDIRIFSQNAPKTTTKSTTSTTKTTSSTSTKPTTTTTTSSTKTTSSTTSTKATSTTTSTTSTASSTKTSTSTTSTKATSTTSSTKTTSSTSTKPTTTTTVESKTTTSTTSSKPATTTTTSSVKTTTTSKATETTTSTTSKTAGVTTSSTSKATDSTSSTTSKASVSTDSTTSTTKAPITTTPTSVASLSTKWSNSTITSSSVEMTTSTVYTTATHTITSCKPTITNCPIGKVTTVTIPLYTTVCPVSPVKTTPAGPKPTKTPGHGGNGSDKTITTKVTKTYTITSCAPTVTNCPVGQVTTEVVTTTYCPGEETQVPTGPKGGFTTQSPFHPSKTIIYNTETVVPKPTQPGGWNNGTSNATTIAQPRPTGAQVVCVGDSCNVETSGPTPTPGNQGCTGPNCPPTVVSGAAKQSLSALVVLGAVAAMML